MFKIKDNNNVNSLVSNTNVVGDAASKMKNFDSVFGSTNIFTNAEVEVAISAVKNDKQKPFLNKMADQVLNDENSKLLAEKYSNKPTEKSKDLNKDNSLEDVSELDADNYQFDNSWRSALEQLEMANLAMQNLKNHEKTKDIFKKLDELCKEHNCSNSNELLEKHSDDPEITNTFKELNGKISENKEVKRLFKQFENANNNFNNELSEMKQIMNNDQTHSSPSHSVHSSALTKFNGNFEKSFQVYDQRQNDVRLLRDQMSDIHLQNSAIPTVDEDGNSLSKRNADTANEERNLYLTKATFDIENQAIIKEQKKSNIKTNEQEIVHDNNNLAM